MKKKLTIKNTRGLLDPCIYMLTAPNGKIYVGSSINGFHLRSTDYRNEKAHGVINNALKKYGAGNFVFSILESSKDWQKIKLQEREQHYLDTLQPFDNCGYNIERMAGIVTKPTRRVSQFTLAGEPVASYESLTWASVITSVQTTSITACCKGKLASAGGCLWLYPEEIIQQEIARRVERAASVTSDPTPRRASQFTRAGVLVKEYPSATQAARDASVGRANITACCKGRKLSAGGFLWLHSEEVTPQEIERRVERAASVVSSDKRGVSQYTLAGVLIKEYEYGAQAARDTGVHQSSITHCCKGELPSAGGYLWIYSKDVTPQEIARRVERAASPIGSNKRGVSQYTRAGVLVEKYESAMQAERDTSAHAPTIAACCKGKRKTTGGFVWKYT